MALLTDYQLLKQSVRYCTGCMLVLLTTHVIWTDGKRQVVCEIIRVYRPRVCYNASETVIYQRHFNLSVIFGTSWDWKSGPGRVVH